MKSVLLLALLSAFPACAGAAACAWSTPPAVVTDDTTLVVSRWDVPDSADFYATPSVPLLELAVFRAWARTETDLTGATVDTDAYALLRRQHALYTRLRLDETESIRLIMTRNLGRIAPMTCLESLIFADHQARFPVQGYTEFMALVLRKDGRLRVYSMSGGVGNGAAPNLSNIRALVDADRAQGWTVELNLHNHPFNFKNPSGDIGATLVPSGTSEWGDISAFTNMVASLGLTEAAITNGFDTIRFSRADIARLAVLR
jgi:hypothetical protein